VLAHSKALILALTLALPFAQSCASIVTGSSDAIRISSVPEGASFETNSGHKGTTPATITISDKETLQVRMSMEGYDSTTIALPPRMSGWFFGNIILGGLVGIVIDLASGNWRTHDDALVVTLMKKATEPTAPVAGAPAPTAPVPTP
jgi:hypothetical protein